MRVERVGQDALDGVALAVTDTGALTVRTADGHQHEVLAGDVHHLRPFPRTGADMTQPDPTRPLGTPSPHDPTRALPGRSAPPREATRVLEGPVSSYTEEPSVAADYRDQYHADAPVVAEPAGRAPRAPGRKRYAAGIVAAWAVVGVLVGAIAALLLLPEETAAPVDTQLVAAANEIAARDQEIAVRDARIAELEGQIATLQAQIAERDAQIAERDAQIAQLQAQQADDTAAQDQAAADREQALQEREAALAEREAALDAREADLAAREQAVAEREQAIADAEEAGGQDGGIDLPNVDLA